MLRLLGELLERMTVIGVRAHTPLLSEYGTIAKEPPVKGGSEYLRRADRI